mgnify:CR=1 FL=1
MQEVVKPRIETEEEAHLRLCTYLKYQYPDVIFTSEQSGLFVTKGQAIKMAKTRSSKALPDLWILEPKKRYHAMLIELKREGTRLYKKNGDLIRDKHIAEQEEMRNRLRNKGYFCEFAVGYDEAKTLIDYYLTDKY